MSKEALVEHLAWRLASLWPANLPRKLLIACSGGPDSAALAHLCCQAGDSCLDQVALAHFNHGLRGDESDQDQIFVEDLSRRLGVPCYAGKWTPLPRESLPHQDRNPQAAARKARYDFLLETARQEDYPVLATAHQREDQIETLLLNFERGGGDGAWLGIRDRIRMQGVWVLRPLLETSRQSLLDYLAAERLPYRIDSSNLTGKYRRNRLRAEIGEKIKTESSYQALLQKRQERIQEEQGWLRLLDEGRKGFLSSPGSLVLPRSFLEALPEDGRFFCLRELLRDLRPAAAGWYPVRRAPLRILFTWLDNGKKGTLCLPGGIRAELRERTLRFSLSAGS